MQPQHCTLRGAGEHRAVEILVPGAQGWEKSFIYSIDRGMKCIMEEYKTQQSMRTNLALLRQRTYNCFLLTLSLMTEREGEKEATWKIKTVVAINRTTKEEGQILHHS